MKSLRKLTFIIISLFISASAVYAQNNKKLISKEYAAENFNALKVSSALDVKIEQSKTEKVVVKTTQKLQNKIVVKVKKGELQIYTKPVLNSDGNNITVYVYCKKLNSIEISGACNLETTNTLKTGEMQLQAGGASDVNINLECTKLYTLASGASDININTQCNDLSLYASGASDINVKGTALRLIAGASGASDINCLQLPVKKAKVEASGSSEIRVKVSEQLNANATAASTILYKGNPPKLYTHSSTSSDIQHL